MLANKTCHKVSESICTCRCSHCASISLLYNISKDTFAPLKMFLIYPAKWWPYIGISMSVMWELMVLIYECPYICYFMSNSAGWLKSRSVGWSISHHILLRKLLLHNMHHSRKPFWSILIIFFEIYVTHRTKHVFICFLIQEQYDTNVRKFSSSKGSNFYILIGDTNITLLQRNTVHKEILNRLYIKYLTLKAILKFSSSNLLEKIKFLNISI